MLKPLAAKIPATLERTPGSFCTRQLRTCLFGGSLGAAGVVYKMLLIASGTDQEGGSIPGKAGNRVPLCDALYSMADVAVDFCRIHVLRDLCTRNKGDRNIAIDRERELGETETSLSLQGYADLGGRSCLLSLSQSFVRRRQFCASLSSLCQGFQISSPAIASPSCTLDLFEVSRRKSRVPNVDRLLSE